MLAAQQFQYLALPLVARQQEHAIVGLETRAILALRRRVGARVDATQRLAVNLTVDALVVG